MAQLHGSGFQVARVLVLLSACFRVECHHTKGADDVSSWYPWHRAPAEDLRRNCTLLRVFVHAYPSKVPSAFFVADVLLRADTALQGRLLAPGGNKATKLQQALAEAGKLKKLWQYLRALWRKSTRSRDTILHDLKSMLLSKAPLEDGTSSLS